MTAQKPKILIVEDEGITAMNMRVILMSKYLVMPVIANSDQVMDAIRKEKPDLVFMDITLLGSADGIEVAGRIKSQYRDVAIVYVTGNSDVATIERAKATNPFKILFKPVFSRELIEVVEQCMRDKPAGR